MSPGVVAKGGRYTGDTAIGNHGEQAGWEDSVPRFLLCLPALSLHSKGLPRGHSRQKPKGTGGRVRRSLRGSLREAEVGGGRFRGERGRSPGVEAALCSVACSLGARCSLCYVTSPLLTRSHTCLAPCCIPDTWHVACLSQGRFSAYRAREEERSTRSRSRSFIRSFQDTGVKLPSRVFQACFRGLGDRSEPSRRGSRCQGAGSCWSSSFRFTVRGCGLVAQPGL